MLFCKMLHTVRKCEEPKIAKNAQKSKFCVNDEAENCTFMRDMK